MAARRAANTRLGLVMAAVVGLAGCGPVAQPAPTPPPAPELVIVTVTPGVPPTPTIAVAQRYVVQQGDTLSGIAERFGVTEDAIMRANKLADRNRVEVGQTLLIPAPES
ncbi:MAG TPA: LysM domain-containing protein [Thermomicrobiales bacterium]|nr:LysM domain-containing protein [Thermomicrobiales bacterium]